ncbi:hypothetical protein DID76_00030 [Candidatus Marinamargulisbacteria bacterium SCGC AG-414-C22]|nr:hypothetical protein DID76_00030 [Candidatus Marinamargulisbacteria bacterium SCGC AG-414-C22]
MMGVSLAVRGGAMFSSINSKGDRETTSPCDITDPPGEREELLKNNFAVGWSRNVSSYIICKTEAEFMEKTRFTLQMLEAIKSVNKPVGGFYIEDVTWYLKNDSVNNNETDLQYPNNNDQTDELERLQFEMDPV